jgi:Xaa-Pro aminopeptidase
MDTMSALPFGDGEYRRRQEQFLSNMPTDSFVIIPNNQVSIRSNDTSFPYRANSYVLYLCGWSEPESIFTAKFDNGIWQTTLFVRPRDTKAEIWEGRRVGPEGALQGWPIHNSLPINDAEEYISKSIESGLKPSIIMGIDSKIDDIILGSEMSDIPDPSTLLDVMRTVKSEAEISVMIEASEIASTAHVKAMRASHPGIGEWQIQSVIEGHFIDSKSQWSYKSIVGGGDNATILHYGSNSDSIEDGELVLVDAGCEVHGYASDITRTWPVNGKFTEPQREIYNLVLEAEEAGIQACKVGSNWNSSHKAASLVLAKGLIDLGILDCTLSEALGENLDGPFRNYFMHGTSHLLGLDVHDVGGGRKGDGKPGPILESGMVLTVEPGLYFAGWRDDVEISERYSGIGIRIEDDVLVTEDGPVVLTAGCPKSIDEIESLIAKGD